MSKRQRRPSSEQELIVYAVHEAGHAVVGHVIGRLIEEVSIVPSRVYGYKGYCRFSAFIESANEYQQWQKGSANPELVTIQYAGMAGAQIICETHGWDYEQWKWSDLADVECIEQWCYEVLVDGKERSRVKKACFKQAGDILLGNWKAVDMLAVDLMELGWTPGNEAHRIIREALGETDDDWRLMASHK